MKNNQYFSITLISAAILSGCNSIPPKNSTLADAHSIYNSAQSNPQVANLAALELKEAGDSLNKADIAFSKGESADTVNQLAYIAKQQVGIAQETTKRKTAELVVANAGAKRDKVRLDARTAEADAANQQVAIMQKTSDKQIAALRDATANAEIDQTRIKALTEEADMAQQQVVFVAEIADQQAAALADADVNAARDQAFIAQQERQLKELSAKKTKRGLVITLGDVLFGTNKAELQSGGTRSVQKLADFLKQFPQQKVLVEGYTDSTGGDSLNRDLSDRRANAVRTALLDRGISSDRVTTHGYGEEYPVAGNETASNRQLNRRVEIIFSDENGNIAPR